MPTITKNMKRGFRKLIAGPAPSVLDLRLTVDDYVIHLNRDDIAKALNSATLLSVTENGSIDEIRTWIGLSKKLFKTESP